MKRAGILLGKLGVFSFRRAGYVLLAALILTGSSAWLVRGLRFDTAYSFVPVGDPEMEAYVASMEAFGDSGILIMRLNPGEKPLSSMDRWTETIVSHLESWEEIWNVESRIVDFDDVETAAAFLRAAAVNSGREPQELLLEKFTGDGLEKNLRRHRKRLLTASDPVMLAAISSDPLNLAELLRPFAMKSMGNLKFSSSSIYLDAQNGRSRILIIHPRGFAEDVDYSRELVLKVHRLMETPELAEERPPGAAYALTGKYAQAAEASRIAVEDMRLISIAAALLVFLLVWSIFRRVKAVFIATIPLAFSLAASFLFAALFFNPLSLAALSFAAIILGLGIDIMLHCTGRLFQVYPESDSLESAVRLTFEDCGPPVTIGILTTSGAFFCLYFARMEGLAQFGLLVSGSLLITLAACLLVFPGLVRLLFPRDNPQLTAGFQKIPAGIFAISSRHPFKALSIGVVLLALSLAAASGFRFEMDIFKGIPDRMSTMETAREVADDFGASLLINTQVIVESESIEEAMAVQLRVDNKLAQLVREHRIAGFQSPSMFLPYPASLDDPLSPLSGIGALIRDRREEFFALLDRLKIRSGEQTENYYAMLESAFPVAWPPSYEYLAADSGAELEKHFQKGQNIVLQTYAWPASRDGDLFGSGEINAGFAEFSTGNTSSIRITGALQFYEKVNRTLRSEFFRISLISLAVILLLSITFLRRPLRILLSLVPLISAIPFTFAALSLLNISFPPAGIGITAMILGIGIDDAVHILVRTRGKTEEEQRLITKEIGPILFMTTLSTMLGFGMLLLSRLYSIRAMGFAVAAGVLGCLLFTILFLPPLLQISGKRGNKSALIVSLLLLIQAPSVLEAGTTPQDGESRLESIIEGLEENFESASAFSVDFKQTRALRQFTEPLIIEGTLVFQKPQFLRLEMHGDENLILYLDGEKVWLEDLDFEEVEEFEFTGASGESRLAGILPPLLFSGPDAISKDWETKLLRTPEREMIRLTPRNPSSSAYSRIQFTVGSFSRITWMKAEMANGDWIETDFSGWKNLPKISEHYFRYQKEQ